MLFHVLADADEIVQALRWLQEDVNFACIDCVDDLRELCFGCRVTRLFLARSSHPMDSSLDMMKHMKGLTLFSQKDVGEQNFTLDLAEGFDNGFEECRRTTKTYQIVSFFKQLVS